MAGKPATLRLVGERLGIQACDAKLASLQRTAIEFVEEVNKARNASLTQVSAG